MYVACGRAWHGPSYADLLTRWPWVGLLVQVPAPDLPARGDIFRVHARRLPLAPDVDLDFLASKVAQTFSARTTSFFVLTSGARSGFRNAQTRGYSGADIENACREAAMTALRADVAAALVVTCCTNQART